MEDFCIRKTRDDKPFIAILTSAKAGVGHTAKGILQKFGTIQTLQDTPVLTILFGISERGESDFLTM